jgi:hypothetical protein
MSHLYSSRKAFLESSNLTAALRGIARLVLSSMGLMENIGFCVQWCVYCNVLLCSNALPYASPTDYSQGRKGILVELIDHILPTFWTGGISIHIDLVIRHPHGQA